MTEVVEFQRVGDLTLLILVLVLILIRTTFIRQTIQRPHSDILSCSSTGEEALRGGERGWIP